jgi:hypothetical protein
MQNYPDAVAGGDGTTNITRHTNSRQREHEISDVTAKANFRKKGHVCFAPESGHVRCN